MTKEIELGELEFKAEDFSVVQAHYYNENGYLEKFVELANRLLRERLAKAPEVFGRPSPADGLYTAWDVLQMSRDTHRARLVCIEEIK